MSEQGVELTLDSISRLARELVLTPSSSNDDRSVILRLVRERLEDWGFDCETVGDDDSPALVASLGAGAPLLSGHLDTVPIGRRWKVRQGEVRDGRLYGRGAADMKGGCAAILASAAELARRNIPVTITFTTDEETRMTGAKELVRRGIVSDAPAVIIGEPTNLKIGNREKGLLQLRIVTSGRSAHASMPGEGENAIHKMLSVADRLRSMMSIPADTMNAMTLNIDVIKGGTKVNVIPDSCEAEIDVRTPVAQAPSEILKSIYELVGSLVEDVTVINMLGPVETPEDADIIGLMKSIRPSMEIVGLTYATEMVPYAEHNRNVIALGPGDPRMAHADDEHVEIEKILDAALLYCEICTLLGGVRG